MQRGIVPFDDAADVGSVVDIDHSTEGWLDAEDQVHPGRRVDRVVDIVVESTVCSKVEVAGNSAGDGAMDGLMDSAADTVMGIVRTAVGTEVQTVNSIVGGNVAGVIDMAPRMLVRWVLEVDPDDVFGNEVVGRSRELGRPLAAARSELPERQCVRSDFARIGPEQYQ